MLSVIIPVYNEIKFLEELLEKVENVKDIEKEIIIVDDGSIDGTEEILKKLKNKYKVIFHEKNMGKGAAIKTGISQAHGDIIIVQDADLEYEPNDYHRLIKPIVDGKAKVVYGSRFLSKNQVIKYKLNWLATKLLNYMVLFLYFHKITDEPTCYKTFDAKLIKSIKLKGDRFDWEPEVTAKILKKGIKIHEVPISYYPRSFKEGKKIGWKDGFQAIWTLIKYRFID
ncbi:MAG: glycosyltransferase family 2 protein [Spirochaetes bacterium]|nr:glycosyltransferase family 2 protein [Spirochaetota bacterium]